MSLLSKRQELKEASIGLKVPATRSRAWLSRDVWASAIALCCFYENPLDGESRSYMEEKVNKDLEQSDQGLSLSSASLCA